MWPAEFPTPASQNSSDPRGGWPSFICPDLTTPMVASIARWAVAKPLTVKPNFWPRACSARLTLRRQVLTPTQVESSAIRSKREASASISGVGASDSSSAHDRTPSSMVRKPVMAIFPPKVPPKVFSR